MDSLYELQKKNVKIEPAHGNASSSSGQIISTFDRYFDHDDEYSSAQRDLQLRLKVFDTAAEKALSVIRFQGKDKLKFALTQESMQDVMSFLDNNNWPLFLRYEAHDKEVNYIMVLSLEEPDAMGDMHIQTSMNRFKDGGEIQSLNRDLNRWCDRKALTKMMQMQAQSSSAADLVDGLEAGCRLPIEMVNDKEINDVLGQSTKLLQFADTLDGLGWVKLMVDFTYIGKQYREQNERAVLVCGDEERHGTIVYMDGNDFCIGMLFDDQDDDHACIFRNTQSRDPRNGVLLKEIVRTKNPSKLRKLLNSMWDQANRNILWMTIPLSIDAYVNIPILETWELKVVTLDKKRELTEEELKNLQYIQHIMPRYFVKF